MHDRFIIVLRLSRLQGIRVVQLSTSPDAITITITLHVEKVRKYYEDNSL